jgi:hypothetical protein
MSEQPAKPAPASKHDKPLPDAEIKRREAIAASSDEAMMQRLPKPPRPFHEQDEDSLHMWLIAVAEAGGCEGLTWCYQPQNWPYGPSLRGRVQHIVGELMRRTDEAQRRKLEAEARLRAEMQRTEAKELRRSKGWA